MNIIKKHFHFLLAAIVITGITACDSDDWEFHDDDDISYEYRETTRLLCDKYWIQDFIEDEVRCTQEFIFDWGRTGVERYTRYYPGNTEIDEYDFYWNWDNINQTSIRMKYLNGDLIYFNNVRVSKSWLTGIWDGVEVEFEGYK